MSEKGGEREWERGHQPLELLAYSSLALSQYIFG